jgi:hypothetical protein
MSPTDRISRAPAQILELNIQVQMSDPKGSAHVVCGKMGDPKGSAHVVCGNDYGEIAEDGFSRMLERADFGAWLANCGWNLAISTPRANLS